MESEEIEFTPLSMKVNFTNEEKYVENLRSPNKIELKFDSSLNETNQLSSVVNIQEFSEIATPRRRLLCHRRKIFYKDYKFLFDKTSVTKDRNFWRCAKKRGCTARLHTDALKSDKIVKIMGSHNHPSLTKAEMETENILKQNNLTEFEIIDSNKVIEETLKKCSFGRWTLTRKAKVMEDFKKGYLERKTADLEWRLFFQKLVNKNGQMLATICNNCQDIFSPIFGKLHMNHKILCKRINFKEFCFDNNSKEKHVSSQEDFSKNENSPYLCESNLSLNFLNQNQVSSSMAVLNSLIQNCKTTQSLKENPNPQLINEILNISSTTDALQNYNTTIRLKDVDGTIFVVKIQKTEISFSEFREIFLIPKNYLKKRFLFKSEVICDKNVESNNVPNFEYCIAMSDLMILPTFKGQIEAEARNVIV